MKGGKTAAGGRVMCEFGLGLDVADPCLPTSAWPSARSTAGHLPWITGVSQGRAQRGGRGSWRWVIVRPSRNSRTRGCRCQPSAPPHWSVTGWVLTTVPTAAGTTKLELGVREAVGTTYLNLIRRADREVPTS